MSEVMQFVFAILAMVNCVLIGYNIGVHRARARMRQAPPASPMTPEEEEKIRQEREAIKEEQKAFLSMMGYNADIAYGVNENPFEGS